jgi:CubicO group peptidase (beta-lactamase class C family)
MTAGHIYTIAGSATGASGASGDRGIATSALLNTRKGSRWTPPGQFDGDAGLGAPRGARSGARAVAAVSPGREIGLAWQHTVRDGERVTWHNGMTGGYSAVVAFNPARRAGIAALANGAGSLPSPLDAPVIDAVRGL